MENRETYIAQNEIKVKNLLSDMYNSESTLLSKINKKRSHLTEIKDEINELEKDYKNQKALRSELTEKFEILQKSKKSDWQEFKKEYEMVLDFAEGDKNSFIQAADAFMEDLNKRIRDLEERIKESSAEAKKKSQEVLNELHERKDALQVRLEEAKADSGEVWREIKQWFIERANSVREMF